MGLDLGLIVPAFSAGWLPCPNIFLNMGLASASASVSLLSGVTACAEAGEHWNHSCPQASAV